MKDYYLIAIIGITGACLYLYGYKVGMYEGYEIGERVFNKEATK